MYQLILTRGEFDGLLFAAARYTAEDTLYDGMELADSNGEAESYDDAEVLTWNIPEHVAWEYSEQMYDEGCSGLMAVLGGTLADKLIAFGESIV